MWTCHAEVSAVILINLLPHREAARKKRQDIFNVSLATSAVAGGVLAGLIFLWLQGQISFQQDQNKILATEIKKLDEQIKDIAVLEQEIEALRARQQAVENLQSDRNLPVHLLAEMVKQLPEGVYLTNLKQDNQIITMQGVAQSNERVAELLRNLANNTPWFTKPQLVEIVAGNVTLSPRDQRLVANFTLRVSQLRSNEAQKAQAAQSGASSASAVLPATATASAPGPSTPGK
jgi:type IV pilus assembly protein PilN